MLRDEAPNGILRFMRAYATLAFGICVASGMACEDLVVPAAPSSAEADAGAPPPAGEGPILLDAGADAPRVVDCQEQQAAFGAPEDLECTGLYANLRTKAIADGVRMFDPGLHLWSDGAEKTRWILLPAGQKIDTTDMNEWRFPVGTRVWKEFKLSGRRVETRFLWKRGEFDWVRTTYRWNDAETAATELTIGATNVGGSTYSIPTVEQCDACHAGRIDKLLGFEAIALSSPGARGLSMNDLIVQQLLTSPPPAPYVIPNDSSGKAQRALGWLHINCGVSCHNNGPASFAGVTGFWLRLETDKLGSIKDTETWKTAIVNTASDSPGATAGAWATFQPDLPPVPALPAPNERRWRRIVPGAPGASLVILRDGKRNEPNVQMPPIATSVVDFEGTGWVRDWIQNGNFN